MPVETRLSLNPDDYISALEEAKKKTSDFERAVEQTGEKVERTASGMASGMDTASPNSDEIARTMRRIDELRERIRNMKRESDATVKVKAEVETPEIPQPKDQTYHVSAEVETPSIPQPEDQTYTIRAEVEPPHLPQIENQKFSVTADTSQAEKSLSDLSVPSVPPVSVTADTSEAEKSLSDLSIPSVKSVSVSADVSEAEKSLSDLSEKSDKSVSIRAELESPDIPQIPDQSYKITAEVDSPDIPKPEDQTYEVHGTLEPPAVPQPEDQTYKISAELESPNIPQPEDQTYKVSGDVIPPSVPEVPDQRYTVTGSVNAPEVPQVADQDYTITGTVDAPEIPQVQDQAYSVSGTVNAPDIPAPEDQQYTVSADTTPAERSLSDLSDLSDKSVSSVLSVTAETSGAEKALSDLSEKSEKSDLSVPVTADTSSAQEALDRMASESSATVHFTAETDEIDYKLTELDAKLSDLESGSTVSIDTAEAEKELAELESRLQFIREESEKGIHTEARVSGTDKVRELKNELNSLPKQKTVEVKADTRKFSLKNVWNEMTSLNGGAKKLVSTILAGGGVVGLVLAGIDGAKKAVSALIGLYKEQERFAAEVGKRNAEELSRAATEQESLRKETDSYAEKLKSLASAEKLSNTQKTEAIEAIRKMQRGYENLGVTVDSVTGKISGLDAALIRKAEIDQERQIKLLEAQLKQNRENKARLEKERDSAGWTIPGTNIRFDNEKKVNESQKQIDEIDNRIMELMRKLNEAGKSKAPELIRERLNASVADLYEQNRQMSRRFDRRRADDALDSPEMKSAAKVENRRKVLEKAREETEKIERAVSSLDKQIQNLETRLKYTFDQKAYDELEDQKSSKLKERLQLQLRFNAAQLNEYDIKQQIKRIEEQRAKQANDRLRTAREELEIQKALLNNRPADAEAVRRKRDFRNSDLTNAEQKEVVKLDQQRKQLSFALDIQRQARELEWSEIEKTDPKKAHFERAKYDAEQNLGRSLSPKESDAIRKLVDLTARINREEPKFNMDIKTNELTARGGFQTGAVVPSVSERYQEAQLRKTNEILNSVRDLNNSMKEYAK